MSTDNETPTIRLSTRVVGYVTWEAPVPTDGTNLLEAIDDAWLNVDLNELELADVEHQTYSTQPTTNHQEH